MYEIEYGTDDTNFTTVDTGSGDTHYNLTGLQHNTTYYIRVVAVNYITFGGAPLRGRESEAVTGVIISKPGEGMHTYILRMRFRMTWCITFLHNRLVCSMYFA